MEALKDKEKKFYSNKREQMNVVIVGHVDHGKSTVIGRLLADTKALPEGKLEAVQEQCRKNAKPFEYAFLLDALKDEQAQGITIDTARCFFKSDQRDYIIIDAPGHIEFLKNMISGAARAEAAMLVIDAHEGIRENSKRHGYMMSFLGIKNINVLVNKMDLVDYDEWTFKTVQEEYSKFLKEINIEARNFIPISAREGDNIASLSSNMPWYKGKHVLEALDQFEKAKPPVNQVFRFPVQDIYKFTAEDDDRRIVAGRVETGTIDVGDEVVFLPSGKTSKVTSIEGFAIDETNFAFAGQSTGFQLDTQIYIRPGEIMCKTSEQLPKVSTQIKVNIFWMGRVPFVKNKTYKLKLATQQVPVVVKDILSVLDASELSSLKKEQVDRHDVAEVVLETLKPVAFDLVGELASTSRFVIVDNYEIAGGGIVLEFIIADDSLTGEHVKDREHSWIRGKITPQKRAHKYGHKSALVVLTGAVDTGKQKIAKALEEELFKKGKFTYFLGMDNNVILGGDSSTDRTVAKVKHVQQIGELAHVMTDAGFILISSISNIDQYELEMLKKLNSPNKTFVVNIGENVFEEGQVDLSLKVNEKESIAIAQILGLLYKEVVLDPEYHI